MESEKDEETSPIESVFVTGSTATSIEVSWNVQGENMQNIQGYRVHFQKIGSRYVQNSPMLPSTTTEYSVANLIMDTYYKVCLIMYRNDTAPVTECIDASTTNWHIPVSIGSSIGAVLALSIIVFLVFVSRCPSINRRSRKTVSDSGKYDSMSSHAHDDNFELSDTTTQAQDDELFSDHDSTNFELMQPLHVPSRHHHHHHQHHHHSDRPANGNRNFIKPSIPAHVLHLHSPRTPKSHQEPSTFFSRHITGNAKGATPPRHNASKQQGDAYHPSVSPPLVVSPSLGENHTCISSPRTTIGAPSPTNEISVKKPTESVKHGNLSAEHHAPSTMPRCGAHSPNPDNQNCMSLPRHMATYSHTLPGDGGQHAHIPKQTVAKLDQSSCCRQHTV